MAIPNEYDEIRPFEPEELDEAYSRILASEQFRSVLAYLFPGVPVEAIEQKMRQCHSGLEFQKAFCYDFLMKLLAEQSEGCDIDTAAIDVSKRYTFVSNHRDIVLDSALLDKLLIDAGFSTTCEIAIGDNLLTLPWVKDLVRINKSFIVERDLPMRQLLIASKRLSEYMHYAISEKNENIWIAQREGRAKNSDDRTQPAILKMMVMGGTGDIRERLLQLHIVPLAISYEYDPCDYLKAAELQRRRDTADFHKQPGEDVNSMRQGIVGYKGRIHYHCAPCIDDFLSNIPADTPKSEIFDLVAEHIDRQIHLNYRLYPCNYIALDRLEGNSAHSDKYTSADVETFDKYIAGQLAKIELPSRDDEFLLHAILTLYANPAKNQLAALQNS